MSDPDALALHGDRPVRERMLPYRRHDVDEADIQSVAEVLRGDWLTNGPTVARFEQTFAEVVGARFAVAFSSGTAALQRPGTRHAWHISPLLLNLDLLRQDRETIFQALRAENIGVSVHYLPVHLHPYYRDRWGTGPGQCPAAEAVFEQLITPPLFPQTTEGDVADVVGAVGKVIRWARC